MKKKNKKEEVWPDNVHVKFQFSPNEAACLQDMEPTGLLLSIAAFMVQDFLHLWTGSINLLKIIIEDSSKITGFVISF